MPTSEYEEDEVENYMTQMKKFFRKMGTGDTNIFILGDWNNVVGDESYRNIVGSHGLGRRNHRGQMLIDSCERMYLLSPTHVSGSQKKTVHM